MITAPVHAAPRDSDSPYGVLAFMSWDHDWNNHHFGKEEDIERAAALMRDAGIRWARMDFLWADLEPEPGHFQFNRYDRIVEILRKHDLHILGLLNYNPHWSGQEWNKAPDTESYLRYARETVRHFKKDVRYWEVWNEPDHPMYWDPQDGLKAYSALLSAAAGVIRDENEEAVVVLGGLSKDYPFNLRKIYKLAGKESFDVVSIHPFVNPLAPNWQTTLRGIAISVQRVMTEFEDQDKPVWFTEIGCPGIPDQGPQSKATWWMGQATSESEQAAFLHEAISGSLALPGVQKVFWAFLRDTGSHFGNAIDSFGLLREDMSVKAAYNAYRMTIESDKKTAKK